MQHITVSGETESQLVPNEHYVVVKRFTSKEQERRVISAFFEGGILPGCSVGFENHLNYFHHAGSGVDLTVAKGLSLYLNSSLVDAFFRQFNGHTQVSAGDLRSLKYPTLDELGRLGLRVTAEYPEQEEIDKIIEREFFSMAEKPTDDPIATKRRIEEAMDVLEQLDLPRQELNERSALTLLALLDLKPSEPWAKSARPLRGIIPIMDFMDTVYGKRYAPNTHETVRRQTICQFIDAGLVIENPDKPERPANSPERVYQVENSALDLLRAFGTSEWLNSLSTYSTSVEALKERYAHEREVKGISVEIASGLTITLSPGGQNMLVEQILSEFAPRFTPNGKFVYVGDNSGSFAFLDAVSLTSLGVEIDDYGKMPDVIVHYTEKNWLVLVEAVTSHGPINPERRLELQKLFSGSTAGLVLVTTFLSRKSMVEYLPEISWETEVWVAEAPAHMIHFNGERFLGPYDA
jgi:adenine-specific DNA-methyltransferase